MAIIVYSSLFAAYPTNTATFYDSAYPSNITVFEDRTPRPTQRGQICRFAGTLVVPIANSAGTAIAPAVGDKWRFAKVPKGARLLDWNAQWGDLDTDGSATLATDFGWEASVLADGSTAAYDCFEDGSTKYQAADPSAAGNSLTENTTETVFDAYQTTVEDYLTITVAVASAALSAAGTITFRGSYYVP